MTYQCAAGVYQQSQRWFKAGVFEAIVDDLRVLLRLAVRRNSQPSAVIFDSRTMQSTPESGQRAGDNGGKWHEPRVLPVVLVIADSPRR